MDRTRLTAFFQACDLASQVMDNGAVAARWQDASALRGFTIGGIAAHLYAHTDDLATSVALAPVSLPNAAATAAIRVFVEMARHRSGDLDVIRAFARRERTTEDALRVL